MRLFQVALRTTRTRTPGRQPASGAIPRKAAFGLATAADLLALQQSVGNRAVSRLVAAYAGGGAAPQVSLHGNTQGNYDGGVSQVQGLKVAPAKGCECTDGPCYRASAKLRITYSVDVTIDMPDVPSGLSKCQEQRVRQWLRDVLAPHEREHARRIRTYNGVTARAFSVLACGRDEVMEAAQAKAQEMHDTEAEKRMQDADALSLAIDPFNKTIDLDC